MSMEAMKQAIEALERAAELLTRVGLCFKGIDKALTSLRQAIAEAEKQEPAAYVHRNEYNEYRLEPTDNFKIEDLPVGVEVMLYPRPQPKREPLSDEAVMARWPFGNFSSTALEFARSIEAAHGIKE